MEGVHALKDQRRTQAVKCGGGVRDRGVPRQIKGDRLRGVFRQGLSTSTSIIGAEACSGPKLNAGMVFKYRGGRGVLRHSEGTERGKGVLSKRGQRRIQASYSLRTETGDDLGDKGVRVEVTRGRTVLGEVTKGMTVLDEVTRRQNVLERSHMRSCST